MFARIRHALVHTGWGDAVNLRTTRTGPGLLKTHASAREHRHLDSCAAEATRRAFLRHRSDPLLKDLAPPQQPLRAEERQRAAEPGTAVTWAESSAVNYGNSVLGVRVNRMATGMEVLCGIAEKVPVFGVLTALNGT